MKKRVLLFLLCGMLSVAVSQNISVLPGDFYRDSKDLTARTQVVKNDNNKNCALLKIITTEKGFTFEPDALGICKEVEYKTSEIWVWLAPGSRRITIKHPQLGQLRDYMYPEAIEASKVYVMKLTTAKINTIVEEVNTSNYVALTVNPAEASVKIDGQLVAIEDGQFQGRFPMGKHDYEVSCDMYHAENGTFTIVPDKTTYLQVNLKPNYGYLKVNSSPEEGALVYVNNRKVGETPYTSDKMLSGTYTVQVVKAMYKEANRQVVIEDGKKLEVQLNMPPNFAEPVISCVDADAEIWVNDEYLGKGSWTGRLSAGPYNVEVKKDRCRTVSRQLELKTGDKPTIDFPAPEPICGKLDVTTKPFGAEIFLDGEKIGKTPQLFDKVQIGKHSLEFRKTGCASVIREITIAEGQTLEVNETLKTGREVTLNTNPSGVEVYVDGTLVGVSPVTTTLSFGTHSVRAEKDGVSSDMEITVSENGESSCSLSLAKDEVFSVKGVTFKMVYVEGGTFTMGCTSEQGNDCDDDERPAHRVTLSSYYIGETEVTQALWEAVMGKDVYDQRNKANSQRSMTGVGPNYPMYYVSWNDVQKFIRRLNQLTGKKFRLPTEAEWEYAARGGNKSKGYKYAGSNNIGDVAWYDSNSSYQMHLVKGKQPNELGLYDMSGNVYEWCSDWYGNYGSSLQTDPTRFSCGRYRVLRGGTCFNLVRFCRSASRCYCASDLRDYFLGFRLSLQD